MKRYFTCHANLEVSQKSDSSTENGRFIEGFVSTPDIDRTREMVDPSSFKETLKTFMKNPILFFNHNWDEGIGKIVEAEIRPGKGLWVRAQIAEGTELAEKVWTLIKQGVYNAFSFAFRISKSKELEPDDKESQGGKLRRIILGLDLLEASVVTIPANAHATFSMAKGMLYGSDMSEKASASEEVTGAIAELHNALITTLKEDREALEKSIATKSDEGASDNSNEANLNNNTEESTDEGKSEQEETEEEATGLPESKDAGVVINEAIKVLKSAHDDLKSLLTEEQESSEEEETTNNANAPEGRTDGEGAEGGDPQKENEEEENTQEDSALLEKIFQTVTEIKGKVVTEEDNPSDNEEENNAEQN